MGFSIGSRKSYIFTSPTARLHMLVFVSIFDFCGAINRSYRSCICAFWASSQTHFDPSGCVEQIPVIAALVQCLHCESMANRIWFLTRFRMVWTRWIIRPQAGATQGYASLRSVSDVCEVFLQAVRLLTRCPELMDTIWVSIKQQRPLKYYGDGIRRVTGVLVK